MKKLVFSICTVLALLGGYPVLGYTQSGFELIFSATAENEATEVVKQLRPVLDDLQNRLSEKIETNITFKTELSPSFSQLKKRFKKGEVDLIRVDAAEYLQLKNELPDLNSIGTEGYPERPWTKMWFVSYGDKVYKNLESIKQSRIVFGPSGSALGHYLAQYHLLQNRLTVQDFRLFTYAPNTKMSLEYLANQKYDVAILSEFEVKALLKKKVPLHLISYFYGPGPNWVVNVKLKNKIREGLHATIQDLDPAVRKKQLQCDYIDELNDSDFNGLRDAIRFNWIFLQKPTNKL